jgi:hypothetical protein
VAAAAVAALTALMDTAYAYAPAATQDRPVARVLLIHLGHDAPRSPLHHHGGYTLCCDDISGDLLI